jgi:two-component system, NtrC family, nitrogen regulation sensor histidine kinase NtrY
MASERALPRGFKGGSLGRRGPWLTHDRRVLLLALAVGGPGSVLGLTLLWSERRAPGVQWGLTLGLAALWWTLALWVRAVVVRPLQTLSNLLLALREDDFSFRARARAGDDPLNRVLFEVNALADTLREQRLGALEATALLRKVMEEIEVAIFAFDAQGSLRLVNHAGETLLAGASEELLGRRASEIGLGGILEGQAPRVMDATFPGGSGRFEVRRGTFRQGGVPHHFLVLSNVSRTLREEERAAWQRLIRVLGHELNNSLAPIQSLSESLVRVLERDPRAEDWEADMRRGLSVVASRSASLSRFLGAYSSLARLPPPQFGPVEIGAVLRRVLSLEERWPVALVVGGEITLQADADQLEQLLINLVRNAVDAAMETGGNVRVGWSGSDSSLNVFVEDEGPGVAETSNLFVPFFTTKPGGTGIGLVLCREIAEAHCGRLILENRAGGGCRALLQLPTSVPATDRRPRGA